MRILWIHGVSTPPSEPYGAKWNATLRMAGVKVTGTEGRWNSSGTFVGDGVFFLNPSFKAEAVERVCWAISDFLAQGPGVIVSHSMGTVLAQEAERVLRTGAPHIYLGSPLSSPFILPGLMSVGLGRPPLAAKAKPVSLWNVDDPIVGGHLKFDVPYLDEVEVSVGGDRFGVAQEEHDAVLYLRTSLAMRALFAASAEANAGV